MENLQQIVLQITTNSILRALAQYGTDMIPAEQKEIIYDDLSESEKKIFDSFIEMIKTK